VEQGEKAVITGKSGSGKSTILDFITGMIRPDKGDILLKGKLVSPESKRYARSRIACVPQKFLAHGKVLDVILAPFNFKLNKSIRPEPDTIEELVTKLALENNILDKDIDIISVGEKLRVALIIAILLRRSVMLLDEVTSALDPETKSIVMKILLSDENLTILSVSHDNDWIRHCTKVIEIRK